MLYIRLKLATDVETTADIYKLDEYKPWAFRVKSNNLYYLDASFHVGDTIKMPDKHGMEDLIEIQADEAELERIRFEYPYFCRKTSLVQRFYGDFARMILANCFSVAYTT